MMITSLVSEISHNNLYLKLKHFCPNVHLFLKLEGLNIAHSIKLKTAKFLLDGLEKQRKITPGKHTIIESSSGNLGVALSILCKERGYNFICVTDPNITNYNETVMRCYGTEVVKVTNRDQNGGYLNTRINFIKSIIKNEKNIIWTNQYANKDNIKAHYSTTAKEILQDIPQVNYVFIGAGTTGTLMGCIKYFKKYSPCTKVIAVDAAGSVTFGGKSKKRYIPGIGTSVKPEIANAEKVSNVLLVDEVSTIRMAHNMLKNHGVLLGGSSASVIQAIHDYNFSPEGAINVVAVCPDFGDKYVDTIYNSEWVLKNFNINI